MPLLDLRDIVVPTPGDGPDDTIFNGVHFNTTALKFWNYTIYSNNTISNNSKCYLVFNKFRPTFLENGTWVNATTCYVPIFGIKERGKLGIAFACIFTLCVLFTLLNLKKHGQQYLREDKRFRLVGRRWQWYWMLFVAACGMISTITSIDVDRNYLQELPIVLTSFFFVLMVPGTLAIVWEAVRHWGSWQERQIVDREPFSLRQDDRRSKTELYMPLLFYFVAWLNFFMDIPRSWGKLEKQHSPEQQKAIAEVAGTDTRFKAGGIIAAAAWFVIVWSLQHSMQHYTPRRPGVWPAITNYLRNCPPKLILALIVLAIRLVYGIFMPWNWQTSIFKFDSAPGWYFGAGYAPSALIIIIFNIWGFIEPNEDKEIMRQRRARGQVADRELGIVKRPHWWRKGRALNDEQRLRDLASEVSGGRHPKTQRVSANVELGNLNATRGSGVSSQQTVPGLRERSRSRPRDDPFRDSSPASSDQERLRPGYTHRDSTVSNMTDLSGVSGFSGQTGLTGRTLTSDSVNAPPQRVRSMLDI